MRLPLVGCLLIVALSTVLAQDTNSTSETDTTTDIAPEEDEYEDIAVAESQDIAHRRYYNSEDSSDLPRPRRRKRRRRLRKRPRSTTPSFIEEYDPERSAKEDPSMPEEEGTYPRRRPTKRRRRPSRRRPEHDSTNLESHEPHLNTDVTQEHSISEIPPEEFHRPRNTQRRRRKGGRKRIRVTTELSSSEANNTFEDSFPEVTTQPTEIVGQTNNHTSEKESLSKGFAMKNEEDVTTAPVSSSFTPKEITEINHQLESLSGERESLDSNYQVSGLGAFSMFQPKSNGEKTTKQSPKEQNTVSSTTPTNKEYSWITRFDPQDDTKISSEEVTTPDTAFGIRDAQVDNVKKEPQTNIKNIDKIIENRKNLFSKSKRLPPTSAVIRRRLQPNVQTQTDSKTTQETQTENIISSVNPKGFHTDKKACTSVECALNRTPIAINSIIPSSLLPSGFPTMPEVISTAELLNKISNKRNENSANLLVETKTESENSDQASSSNIFVITPSTLIASPNYAENTFHEVDISKVRKISEQVRPVFVHTYVQRDESIPKISETSTAKTTTKTYVPTSTKTETTTSRLEYTIPPEMLSTSTENPIQLNKGNTNNDRSNKDFGKLTLEGVDVTNINDEILELIMDEMGKSRVKRILELRNMTLSELIAHRERGAGHFSTFNDQNHPKTETQENEEPLQSQLQRTDHTSGPDGDDEETAEEMIIEKAKHFMSEFKKNEDSISSVMKISPKEKFDLKGKVEEPIAPMSFGESKLTSTIQFPEDGILGAFPKYMFDIAGKPVQSHEKEEPPIFKEHINKPKVIRPNNDKREPRVFDSMPKFNSETSSKDNLEMSPFPDWRITISKSSTEKSIGFPGISQEIMLVATSTSKSKVSNIEDVMLLDEGEEIHHRRNHILGGNIDVETDDDYPETKRVPASVKSAIAASGALLGLAIFGFLAVLVSCKIRQRRARLRARRDILCEHLAEDFRSSQRSHTPVLRKSPFNTTIQSNTASNRHYYLWRTLRKTFQYE